MAETDKKPGDKVLVPKSAFSPVSRIEEVEHGGCLATAFMDKNKQIDWLTEWRKMDALPVIDLPKTIWGRLRSLVKRDGGIMTPGKKEKSPNNIKKTTKP
jgi:hypothetical protein